MQDAAAYPFEVGGDYWQRESYKRSVIGDGGWTAMTRPETVGYLLKAWFGSASSGANGDGSYTHIFVSHPQGSIPWVTLVKNVSGLFAERHMDARCASIRFTVPTANLMSHTARFIAAKPEEVLPADYAMAFEDNQAFQTCTGQVTLDGSTTSNDAKATNVTVDLVNGLTNDEFSIGSYFLDDITLLSKSARVSYDLILRDRALWAKVFRNNAAQPSTGQTGAFDPLVFQGSLKVRAVTGADLPGTARKGSLELEFAKLDFLALPVALTGADLVRVTLAGQVTLVSGTEPVKATLVNKVASY